MNSYIELNNVSLDYIVRTGTLSIRRAILHKIQCRFKKDISQYEHVQNSSFRALDKICLKINKGDRVGLIGCNGAGKSTLLRLIAKIYQPTCGNIVVQGKICSLFDVHLGMNDEATGYENILNLAVMRGHNTEQALSIVREVEDFTELGEFLYKPIRTYSTGMKMRLSFAVATAIAPNIMLIDEIVGTGDNTFFRKATTRIQNIMQDTHILLLASHSNEIIQKFCNKALLLDKGKIKFFGDIHRGLQIFANSM